MTNESRDAFEAKWPTPAHCAWTGNGYCPTEFHAWDADAHRMRWQGWQAALQWAASQQAAVAPLPFAVFDEFGKGCEDRVNDHFRAAAPAQQAAAGWQPISEAPKDGRTVLLGYFNSRGKWRTMRGQWMSEDYIAEYWEEPDDVEPGWFETVVEGDDIPNCWSTEPTHWMPLPAAPTAQGERDE
jgi:hypothetical protein